MAIRFLNSQSIDGELTVTGNVGIGTTSPSLSYGGKGLQIQNTDTAGLRLTDTTGSDFDISARSGDVLLYEGEGNPIRIGVGGNEKMRITNDGRVGIGTTSPDYELDVTGDIRYSGTLFNGLRQEYSGSNFISANQAYTGNLVGSYFVGGDYQKIVTIIPSGSSQNYQIVGNIYVQSGASTQVIKVNASLRSNTLPDLSWEIYYEESNTGTRFVKPFLWKKETTTASFIFGIEVLSGITIYGSVTADLMINSRSSADKANVSINTVTASDQTTIDTGYTQQEFTQRSTWDEEKLGIGTTNPGYLLDVQSSADSVIRVKTIGTGPSSDSEIRMEVAGTTQSNYIRFGDSGNDYAGGIRYQHVNNSMQFRVNAAERMRIDTAGNVGIGTTSPAYALDVSGDIRASDDLFVNAVEATANITGAKLGINYSSPTEAVEVNGIITAASGFGFKLGNTNQTAIGKWYSASGVNYLEGDSTRSFQIGSATNGVNVRFDNANNRVGIGTTSPGAALTVGDSTSTGNHILVEGSSSDNTYTVFEGKRKYPKLILNDTIGSSFSLWNLGNTLRFGTNVGSAANAAWYTKSGDAADVIFNGDVGIGVTSPSQPLHVNGNARVTGVLYADTGIYSDGYITADGNIKTYNDLEVDGSAKIEGNTGLGTSNPTQKLHVNGNARVTGAYYDSNNSPGTSGQVLSSTATGTDWVDEGSSVGVSSIVAGTNITISPSGGTGAVTINASSGGGGGGSRTASFNSAFFQTGTGNYYLPISTESESTSRQRYNTIVPPFNAYLKSVTISHSSVNAPTSGTRTFTMQDSSGTTIEAITVNYNDYVSVGTGRYTFTFTFTSSAAISAGRPFWIYGTNNLNVGWGNAVFTILLEEQ